MLGNVPQERGTYDSNIVNKCAEETAPGFY